MKYLFILFLFVSCNSSKKPPEVEQFSRFEKFLGSFINKNKEGLKNSVLVDETGEKLRDEYFDSIPNGLFSDFPLELFSIKKVDGKYYAQFQPDYREIKSEGFSVHFDLVALIDKDMVKTLEEKKHYFVWGENQRDISRSQIEYVYTAYTPLYRIEENYSSYDISLGITLIKLTNFKKAE